MSGQGQAVSACGSYRAVSDGRPGGHPCSAGTQRVPGAETPRGYPPAEGMPLRGFGTDGTHEGTDWGRYAPDFAEATYIVCVAGRAPHPEGHPSLRRGTRGCPYDARRGEYLPQSAHKGMPLRGISVTVREGIGVAQRASVWPETALRSTSSGRRAHFRRAGEMLGRPSSSSTTSLVNSVTAETG